MNYIVNRENLKNTFKYAINILYILVIEGRPSIAQARMFSWSISFSLKYSLKPSKRFSWTRSGVAQNVRGVEIGNVLLPIHTLGSMVMVTSAARSCEEISWVKGKKKSRVFIVPTSVWYPNSLGPVELKDFYLVLFWRLQMVMCSPFENWWSKQVLFINDFQSHCITTK